MTKIVIVESHGGIYYIILKNNFRTLCFYPVLPDKVQLLLFRFPLHSSGEEAFARICRKPLQRN